SNTPERPCVKSNGGKRQANTGSAGALARYEREARNSYVKKFEIERVAHAPAGNGARAPSTNRPRSGSIDFLGKAPRNLHPYRVGNATTFVIRRGKISPQWRA